MNRKNGAKLAKIGVNNRETRVQEINGVIKWRQKIIESTTASLFFAALRFPAEGKPARGTVVNGGKNRDNRGQKRGKIEIKKGALEILRIYSSQTGLCLFSGTWYEIHCRR